MRQVIYIVVAIVSIFTGYWLFVLTNATANMHTRLKLVESQMHAIKELQNGGQTGIQP